MNNELWLCVAGIREPTTLLSQVQERLKGRLTCGYLYPQQIVLDADIFASSHGPLMRGSLPLPETCIAQPLSQLTESTVVLDLDGLLLAPRYQYSASDAHFIVPEFVQTSWNDEQRAWLESECRRLPVLSQDAVTTIGRELVEKLVEKGNRVIICDAIERPSDVLPEGFATADALQMALMELNLLARTLSAELGVLIMHTQIGVQSSFGGATALQTDYRRGGKAVARLLADELRMTLEQVPELDWFAQERVRVEEKMDAR